MDPKASAKSKRTHSQHGRRNHPPPAASVHKKKPQQQVGGEETVRRTRSHTLPSNWDRYSDNEEEEAENPVGAKQADAEVAPKSKGADFGYLIELAQSQPPELGGLASESSAFNEFHPDFTQGVSSMLSVRGKKLLSWCGDDNFIVDDDPTSSYEVPYLSMDLHALASQLSKLKVSQRLFIEADLLPEEMCVDESQASAVSEEQSETLKISELRHGLDPPAFIGYVDSEKAEDSQNSSGSSSVVIAHEISIGEAVGNVPSGTSTTKADKPVHESKPPDQSNRREVQDSMPGTSIHTIPDSKSNQTSRFEAGAAEAELNMLLDSFGQSSLSESFTDGFFNNNSTLQNAASGSLAPTGLLSTSQDLSSSKNGATVFLDDTIDELLAETSLYLKEQKHTASLQKKEAVSSTRQPPHFSPSGSRPMNVPSFSRHEAVTAELDDSIDDLLAGTSIWLGDQKQTAHQQKVITTSTLTPPHSAAVTSKAMDDFDSWLDTL